MPIRSEKLIGQMVRTALSRTFSRTPSSRALALRPAYAAGLRDAAAVARSVIPVDKIDAPILAIAGADDQSYPAVEMGRALMKLRTNTSDRMIVLDHAGHFIKPPATPTTVDRNSSIISGGTPAGIARGQRAAWTATLEFLDTQLRS